jgi:hypothetical protein
MYGVHLSIFSLMGLIKSSDNKSGGQIQQL